MIYRSSIKIKLKNITICIIKCVHRMKSQPSPASRCKTMTTQHSGQFRFIVLILFNHVSFSATLSYYIELLVLTKCNVMKEQQISMISMQACCRMITRRARIRNVNKWYQARHWYRATNRRPIELGLGNLLNIMPK